ncbi:MULTISPECIES: cytochrome P450 [Pseudomonas]|uniref:Cytochrome p450 oxidoreductase n=2 Tax=Pseudomonas fluorescens TaxID=294 RepID=C3KCY4_PSEFS|nr:MULTISPECIES: cytochrome P450 [Pseudomonas]MBZ6454283.1 cytochrome P450 [Pseudomonas fluorescens group sp.]MBZ6460269.1 cytochrome P450 [Pseudomonas fluorescens group sp.]MBZ6465910.1 cytochrome P450 [Pseudomonas fluorescens group sp.]WPN20799.1 cytochrome P450 [Pseudomonas marginalis]WQD69628.1 cytochrome P450 [Pseudomonas marginalis]
MTPFEAATHADPYGYYSNLRRKNGLLFDAELGLWIASSANAVEAILGHPDCRVRPLSEPIPPAIARGAAGVIFGRLMRMNEGPQHLCPRMAIEPALASVGKESLSEIVSRVVETLDDPVEDLDELMFTLPVSVIAALIGLPSGRLHEVAKLTRDFVACLSPLSDEIQLGEAHFGATRLNQLFSALLSDQEDSSRFMSHIRSACAANAWSEHDALIANLIGLLSQTCEATAGLIGNTLVALHRYPDLTEGMQPEPMLVADLVAEVARYDSPVQNTRRFVAKRCIIGDSVLEAGDTVLVLLASANRDPYANPHPDSLLLKRTQRRTFSFGSGRHECPGQQLALTIAAEAILAWLHRQPTSSVRPCQWGYLRSLNGRIPQFNRDRDIHRYL